MKRSPSIPWLWLLVLAVLGTPAAWGQLRIVTVVPAAANQQFADEDGDYPAYIEIRSLETGILQGHFLTDQATFPGKWQIPAGYVLTSGQTLRIFASGKNRRPTGPGGILHTSFTYDCSVPYCGLFSGQQQVHSFADPFDLCACDGLSLIGPKAVVRVLIPSQDLGTTWAHPAFDDSKWLRGVTGVGYETGSSPYQDGLVLYHTFDKADLSGKIVKDVSGPILHPGTMSESLSSVVGRIAQGLEYKGEPTHFTRVTHHAELDPGTGSFAVAIWFKAARGGSVPSGASFTEALVAKFASAGGGTTGQANGGWSVYRTQAGTFVQTMSPLGTRTVPLGFTPAGVWHHAVLVVQRTSGQVIGFLNGKRVGVTSLGQVTESIASASDLFEARDPAGNFPFAGVLDDLSIWKRGLSDAEVSELFSIGKAGKSHLDASAFPDSGQLYAGLIGFDVQPKMKDFSASAYIRVPFNLPSVPALANSLRLRVHYDDGFVAYLNGAEVARRNAPEILDDFASAPLDRPDAAALAADTIDLSPFLGLLKPGGNVLAFHALNHTAEDQRFLLHPVQLCLGLDSSTTPGGNCIKETNGRDFWIAFPQNYAQEPDTPLRLSVCIAGAPATVGIIDIPGLNLPGFPKPFLLPASGTMTLPIPAKAELAGSDTSEPKGIHILASRDVAVYGTTRMDFTTDTFLGLPTKCLGTEYLVCAYKNVFSGIPILNGTQFAIVAIANKTEITIVPPAPVGGHPGQVPYVVTLDRGQTYQLRNEAGQPADLTGTQIVATKPIAVFGSHRCANVQSLNQFFCDTVVEQLLPLNLWGESHFVAPLATRKGDTLRILSGANQNLITLATTGGSQNLVLNRAEYKDLPLELATRVSSRGPVTVMQFSNSSDADHVSDADPFMTLIQPSPTWLAQYRFCTPPASDFARNYVNLVAPSASALELITINGVVLSGWNPALVSKGAFPGGVAYARVELLPDTTYNVLGREPIGLTAYGFSEFDSYGYPGGMRFADNSPPILSCPGEITVHCEPRPGLAGAPACVALVPDLTQQLEAFDDCTSGGRILLSQTPKAGELRPLGTYPIVITAVDGKGAQTQCTVKFVVLPKWTEQQFGASVAANPSLEQTVWGATADPDQDGLANDIEESLGSNPNQKDSLPSLLQIANEADEAGPFSIVYLPQPASGDAPRLELEGLPAFDGSLWESGPDLFEELPARTIPGANGQHPRIAYKVRQPPGDGSVRSFFLRVKLKP